MSDNQAPIGASRRARRAAEEAARVEQISAATTGDAVDNAGDGRPRPKRKRKPFGNLEARLAYPDREGYHRHWFNDEPGRLLRAADAGYEQVRDESGRPVSMVVGISRGGGPLTAYLHEIPQEDYDEDMAAQESVVHERLGQIERGQFERPSGRDGQLAYAGSTRGNISITSSNRR